MPIKDKFREVTFQKFDANTHLFTVLLHEEKELGVFHENCILNLELRSEIKKTLSKSKDFPIFADYDKENPYIFVSNSDNSLHFDVLWIAVHEVGHALMVLHHKYILSEVVIDYRQKRGITNQKEISNDRQQLDIHVAGDAATSLFGFGTSFSLYPKSDFEQFKDLSLALDGSKVNIKEYNEHTNEVRSRFLKPKKAQIYFLAIELLRSEVICGENFERMCEDFNSIPKIGGT